LSWRGRPGRCAKPGGIDGASLLEINARKGGYGGKPSRPLLSRVLKDKTALVLVRRSK